MLKGKTKIELRDVHTGEVEVIEKENMITNALQYIFNPLGFVKSADPMYTSSYVNFYETLTGGLLLLNKTLTEDADNIVLPRDVEQTGCAVYNKQNTSDQTLRGNCNATETEIDIENRRIKYVYDFDTAEANGTIACVALTHALGGYGNRGTEEAPVRGLYPFYSSIGNGLLRLTGSNSGIKAYDRVQSYTTYGSAYKWIIKIDAETDSVYYFTITDSSNVKISRYRANINTVSLFDTPSTSRVLLEEWDVILETEINQQYFSYNYDEEADKLYIMSSAAATVASNGTYMITEIDMSNDFSVKQYTMINKTGMVMRTAYEKCSMYCYEGYVYFQNYNTSTHYIFRQEIGNSANVSQLGTTSLKLALPMMARNGKVYFEYASSNATNYCCYVVDVDSFSLKYPETYNLYDANFRQFVPVKGAPLTYYLSCGTSNGTFAVQTDYLATINNLESPVVKTADKTMKITYVLQEQ